MNYPEQMLKDIATVVKAGYYRDRTDLVLSSVRCNLKKFKEILEYKKGLEEAKRMF